ncbi:MAG: NPCBM/NEW2 domain-containing protein [Armatimonadetes bacterium]|nr:NPCBM/NEW2 domain-containing protein [Candidatus Hippobium faecium]
MTDRDGNIISVSEIPYLAPNSTETAEFEVKQENLGYTSYYAVADYENQIKETDKKDNILPLPMDILCYEEKTPSLEIKNLNATVSGNSVTVKGETNEQGEGYITFKQEDALYYVHNFTCDGNINETVSLPDHIPSGIYTIEAGIYQKEPVNHITVSAELKTSAKNTRKPMGYGTFTDMEKVPHFWYINHANMLMWESKPYFTFGYMFVGTNFVPDGNSAKAVRTYDATMEELLVMQGVNACGITDMENTAKIKPYMEQAGMTYSAFAGEGNVIYWMKYPLDSYLVKNGKYMTDLTEGKGEYTFTDLNGEAIKGYHILIYDLTDNIPIECIPTDTDQTKIDISVTNPLPGHNYRAYITPRVIGGHTIHDYWSAWEDRLEFAKEAIAKQKYPKGVRYAIDPFENEEGFFFNNDPYKIPVSDAYLKTFEEYLRNKYTDIEKLNEAWAVTDGNIKDFASATHLTPLQIIGENSYLYNNTENTVITLNAKRSLYWYDTLDARDTSLLKLHNEYADWFKQYCNVPIVSKRVGGHSKAFTPDTVWGGFDGVAVDCYNLKTKINKVTGSFLADIEDSPKTCWFPTLEINYETPSTTKPTEGWPDETVMREDFARFLEMGVRGFNIFALDLRNTAEDVFAWPKFDAMLHPYQIEWYKNIKTDILNNIDKLENLKPKTGYIYPTLEPELNAFVYNNKSHSGLGWSSTQAKNGYWFIPTNNFNHNNLTVCSLPDYPISRVYGEKLNTAIEENKCPILYVGLRKDLGQIPALDTYFTEEFFTVHNSEGDVTCQKLDPKDGFRPILEKDGAVYGMEREGLTIIAMDTDPVLYTEEADLPMTGETEDISREILGVSSSTENNGSNLTEKDFTLDETGKYIYLSEVNPTYAKQGWGVLEYDHNLDMGPLGCKGIKFAHGLASHAPAEIIYNLEGKYKKFACFIGIADVYTDMGSVTYEIFADGKNIFSSGLVKGSDLPGKLELDIQGVNELKFIIGDGGDSNHADHASLFEARLYY